MMECLFVQLLANDTLCFEKVCYEILFVFWFKLKVNIFSVTQDRAIPLIIPGINHYYIELLRPAQ